MAGHPSSAGSFDSSIITLHDRHDDIADIAPWQDVPPTPPPKSPGRMYGFPMKQSFTSLLLPGRRPSESQASLGASDHTHTAVDDGASCSTLVGSRSSTTTGHSSETRRSKGSLFSFTLPRKSSKAHLRNEDIEPEPEPPLPILPDRYAIANASPLPSLLKKDKRRHKKSFGSSSRKHSKTAADDKAHLHELDDDVDKMDGIVDFSKVPSGGATAVVGSPLTQDLESYPVPESWAVVPKPGEADRNLYYSDDSEAEMSTANVRQKINGDCDDKPSPSIPEQRPSALPPIPPPRPAQSSSKRQKTNSPKHMYMLRIYKDDEHYTYHTALLPLRATVEEFLPALSKKLFPGQDVSGYGLYLKERGRERLLALKERPADIVRRRLEQAGYETNEAIETLKARSISFLLGFVYKDTLSPIRGSSKDDIKLDGTIVDLTGRSLKYIPVSLYSRASTITVLKLSRNPMLEIPLDFIQECTSLRDLKLSHMAMKHVPSFIRHLHNLTHLDLSSNRILNLEEAYLDGISTLMELKVHNNRIERLPWHFARMKLLTHLNISNNRFREFPAVVTGIEHLSELDISFNLITELPEDIVTMRSLRKLTMVGNYVTVFPRPQEPRYIPVEELNCQRNRITHLDLSLFPNLERLYAEHNNMRALELPLDSKIITMRLSHNDLQQISLAPGLARTATGCPLRLTELDLSHAKLRSFDDATLKQLSMLKKLVLSHNSLRSLPEVIGELSQLTHFYCSNNELEALPSTIGNLESLVKLDLHNNRLCELPVTLWNCGRLVNLNLTSNGLASWMRPPPVAASEEGRKYSVDWYVDLPLSLSLEKLYLGENQFTGNAVRPLRAFRKLSVLNLSFNFIEDLPPSFLRDMTKLEELYLSGNKLTRIPTDDLSELKLLTTLFLNGNRLLTLPKELGDLTSLTKLDVGSNLLRYNINNEDFDWHWKSNPKLMYLNLSGNNRFTIKSKVDSSSIHRGSRDLVRTGFTELPDLRVLGLVDVTFTKVDMPDETENRRVRTSHYDSTINGMAYGIADLLGKCVHITKCDHSTKVDQYTKCDHRTQSDHLTMLDMIHKFPGEENEAVFAMFGQLHPHHDLSPGVSPNKMTKFLQQNFVKCFLEHKPAPGAKASTPIPDALRRTFLDLNQELHDYVFAKRRKMSQVSASAGIGMQSGIDLAMTKSGAEGVVLYFKDKTLYVANVGSALAVVSRQGVANNLSKKHDPHDCHEIERIRNTEGWISKSGFVNDEHGVSNSRSFGYFQLVPIINARPDVRAWDLTKDDEFVIVANGGLWNYVSYQTAVDIVHSVPGPWDPMMAAQKLRDLAIGYGADCCTMIMVIRVADLFGTQLTEDQDDVMHSRVKLAPAIESTPGGDIAPPVGHIALVFTDIRNSTHLWDVNPRMPDAIRMHNTLLRRQLRFCGGYEVKTEGDAFMCSFPNVLSAVWWCLRVQEQLVNEPWPHEIIDCEDGKVIKDSEGRLIARGISVRMGIHCGNPICEPDPVTQRMDYFGPMVNRSARINGSAAGGQIMISADVEREIKSKVLQEGPASDLPPHLQDIVEKIRQIGPVLHDMGEVKLKGLELPENLFAMYPRELAGRHGLKEEPEFNISGASSSSKAQLRNETWQLGLLCLRLEALATRRIFRKIESNSEKRADESVTNSLYVESDPLLVLPPINEQSTDSDLRFILDSLSVRIQNAVTTIVSWLTAPPTISKRSILEALSLEGGLDEATLEQILSILNTL